MEFIHIRDGDYTCQQWFDNLNTLERESSNGEEVTVVRTDSGFATKLYENEKFIEDVAIHLHIAEAYDYVRCYLKRHPETGFYIV